MLVNEQMLQRFESVRTLTPAGFNFSEAISHLTFEDGAELIAAVVERASPRYHQYFPAQAMQFRGRSTQDLIEEFYAETPLEVPLGEIAELIDVSELECDMGWRPTRRIMVPLDP